MGYCTYIITKQGGYRMNKKGIPGVPYFGLDTQEIEENIKTLSISFCKEYDSLYELVQEEKSEDKVVVIEDGEDTWLSFFRDIKFNYRDREVFIPYYVFDIMELKGAEYKNRYKGHIFKNEDGLLIRYNYQLCKRIINLDYNFLILYDFESNQKYKVVFRNYFNSSVFDIQGLYDKYINSCVDYEDYLLFKHVEGYHLISRRVDKIKNEEQNFRKKFGLSDYRETNVDIYYRDVRNLSKDNFDIKIGVEFFETPYWERLLDFESLLFCILRVKDKIEPNDLDFAKEWEELGGKRSFIKYGNRGVPLIFKSYWMDGVTRKIKTWSRGVK